MHLIDLPIARQADQLTTEPEVVRPSGAGKLRKELVLADVVQAQLGQRDLRPSLGDSIARTVAASKSAGQ